MRVMRLHASYRELGGEDVSVRTEVAALRAAGHEVDTFFRANDDAVSGGAARAAAQLWRTAFDRRLYAEVRARCRAFRPDVAHADNLWFALSPSVHRACRDEGVPTVQSLRNYRLLCVGATLMRDGAPCERCVGGSPWPGVANRCYRDSTPLSAAVARMILENRRRGTWLRDVDRFVAPSTFARAKFVAGGLPADRIVVKPNCCPDPGAPGGHGRGALFVGRLSAEKGVHTLLDAWRRTPGAPLEIVGDGPERARLEQFTVDHRLTGVVFAGRGSRDDVLAAMQRAAFVVVPSESYETFGRVVPEAFACARPVIVSDLGAPRELVSVGETGLAFTSGDPVSLGGAVDRLLRDPSLAERMGRTARARYLRDYTPAANVARLETIYADAIASHDTARREVRDEAL